MGWGFANDGSQELANPTRVHVVIYIEKNMDREEMQLHPWKFFIK
jgi:hypothetical protein